MIAKTGIDCRKRMFVPLHSQQMTWFRYVSLYPRMLDVAWLRCTDLWHIRHCSVTLQLWLRSFNETIMLFLHFAQIIRVCSIILPNTQHLWIYSIVLPTAHGFVSLFFKTPMILFRCFSNIHDFVTLFCQTSMNIFRFIKHRYVWFCWEVIIKGCVG